MASPRAGFGLVSLKTGRASDAVNILAIGGIRLNQESVRRHFRVLNYVIIQKIINRYIHDTHFYLQSPKKLYTGTMGDRKDGRSV